MLWTWVLVCLIGGELLLYFILTASKALLPFQVTPPIKTKVFFYALCLCLFMIGGVSFFSFSDTHRRLKELEKSYDQLTAVERILDTILGMESSQRGYLITRQDSHLELYNRLHGTIEEQCKHTMELYAGTIYESRAKTLCDLVNRRVEHLDRKIEIKKTGNKADVEEALLLREGKEIMDLILRTAKDLEDHRRADYNNLMAGLYSLGSVRVYTSFLLMIGALVQMVLAAILGRSRIPSPEIRTGETFFP